MQNINSKPWKSYLSDIRFWIVIFFIVRLYGITNPPLEGASTWRQCDGLMIARNFYEIDSNILYPRVDLAGEKTGITGPEFPILNYLVFLVSLVFGFQDWYGRLINLIISSAGTWFFYRIIKKEFDQNIAFNSSIILIVSMWFSYSRIFIPDIFGASLCIIAIYYGIKFLENGSAWEWAIFSMTAIVGCLSKISSAALLTVMLLPIVSPKYQISRKAMILLGALLTLFTVYVWYFIWVPYLNVEFGFGSHFFMGQSFLDGLSQHIENWKLTAKRFYETPLKYSGFVIFIIGLVYLLVKKDFRIIRAFGIPFFAFLIISIVAGWGFYVNSYYPIMFVPTMALIMGAFLSKINFKLSAIILLLISIEGIANQLHVFSIRESMKPFETISTILNQVGVNKLDLIAINSNSAHDPTPMYFAHRRGWGKSNEELQNPAIRSELISKGCKFIVVLGINNLKKIDLELPRIYDSELITIYKL